MQARYYSLPIFHPNRAINLLNQNRFDRNDDEFTIDNHITWCKCGKQQVKSKFIPHKNFQIISNNTVYCDYFEDGTQSKVGTRFLTA